MQRTNPYKKYLETLHQQERKRMGYPLTGSVNGFFTNQRWVTQPNVSNKLIPRVKLGIAPDSLSDVLMLNIGDPASAQMNEKKRHAEKLFYPEDMENKVLSILATYFKTNLTLLKGYVTSGGTEASLACVWWLRNFLMSCCKERDGGFSTFSVTLYASESSHYSCMKISQMLSLEHRKIFSDDTGRLDLVAFRNVLRLHMKSQPRSPMIVWLNAGTTVLGAVDDLDRINQLITTEVKNKGGLCCVHVDGAILGITLPLLYPEYAEIFKFADSFSLSGHKLLATSLACGVALAKKEIVIRAFADRNINVGYVHDIQDITVTGGRSAQAIMQLHLSLTQFEIDQHAKKFRLLLTSYLENAQLLKEELASLIGEEHITYNANQFNVIFPLFMREEHAEFLKERYTLMPLPDNKVCVTVFANVDMSLILEFIDAYKKHYVNPSLSARMSKL
jgi:glutamate/tyrosine decarboxylase-like PLP-dependent enzyme